MARLTSDAETSKSFDVKAGFDSGKLVCNPKARTNAQISKCLIYIRYKDHVFFKNIVDPMNGAVIRETVGWLREENDELIMLESDREIIQRQKRVNGIIILKSCILEMQQLPLQLFSKWDLNYDASKQESDELSAQTIRAKFIQSGIEK